MQRISFVVLACLLPVYAHAQIDHTQMDHGGELFHAFTLEVDAGASRSTHVSEWDLDGWVGGDDDKLWIKSEGERSGSTTEQAEFWAMESHAISTFWDAQLGVRFDAQPHAHTFLVAGFNGLAPYYVETEAHVFLRNDGGLSARLRLEHELLLTNRLIAKPYTELDFNTTPDRREGLGAGFAQGQYGLQLRYEITRGFAPYVDVHYDQKYGATADGANREGEHSDAASLNAGVRLMF